MGVCACMYVFLCVYMYMRQYGVFLPINHEWIIGSLLYLRIRLILMRQKSSPKFKITRSKVKVKCAIIQKSCFG